MFNLAEYVQSTVTDNWTVRLFANNPLQCSAGLARNSMEYSEELSRNKKRQAQVKCC